MPLYSWTLREYFDSEIETINKQDFRKAEKYWDWISKIVSRISEAGGFNITKSQLEEDIEDIFSFEWKLLKVFFLSFFFFLQTPLPLVITHPRGRLLNLSPLVNSSLPPPSIPTFNPERPHSCGKIIVATRLTIRSYIFYYFSTWKKIQANLFFSLSLFLLLPTVSI